MERQKDLSYDTCYTFPNEIEVVHFNEKILVVYTEGVLWLLLQNENQLKIFYDLQTGKTIGDVLQNYDNDDVINVITEIEAKQFCSPIKVRNGERNMYIYLTNRCNEYCKHCYMYANDVDYTELSVEQWKHILSSFRALGGNGVTFTGGEITVYNGFDLILRWAHDIGLKVTILSNGLLWDEKLVESLYDCIDEIQISVDGYDEKSYQKVRNVDGFAPAINAVELFLSKKVKTAIAVTPLYDDIDNFVEHFKPFAKKLQKKWPDLIIRISYELLDGRTVKKDDERKEHYSEKMKELLSSLYPNYFSENFYIDYVNDTIRGNCGFGEISIAPNGDVFWCNRVHELQSNVNAVRDGMERIVLNSKMISERTHVTKSKICSKCCIKYICNGGCRMNYPGIKEVTSHIGMWDNCCTKENKNEFFQKMIDSNDLFYI